ncbi:hypothetical protein [Actinomadura terrae]|uniref:hypothetical protein n=1 Tax=Actinomadura terrae TaxID=604353 RepID=UPI001FA733AD|nr:hypothetical protein [Actinomadura terrae]
MTRFKRLRATTAIIATGLALPIGAFTANAYAATGTFFYHSPESGDLEINNPDDGECRLLLQGADRARNATNATASLFSDRGCENAHSTLSPGQSKSFPASNLPHSVLFHR